MMRSAIPAMPSSLTFNKVFMKFFFVLSPKENPDMYITGDPKVKGVLTDSVVKAHRFNSTTIMSMGPMLMDHFVIRVVMDHLFISGPIRPLSLQEMAEFNGIGNSRGN